MIRGIGGVLSSTYSQTLFLLEMFFCLFFTKVFVFLKKCSSMFQGQTEGVCIVAPCLGFVTGSANLVEFANSSHGS